MAHQHQFRTITEFEDGYIGICETCRTVNLAYKNSLFCVPEAEFDEFRRMLDQRIGVRYFPTSHGKEMLLHTPTQYYSVLFSEDELDELLGHMAEVALVLEANRILNP